MDKITIQYNVQDGAKLSKLLMAAVIEELEQNSVNHVCIMQENQEHGSRNLFSYAGCAAEPDGARMAQEEMINAIYTSLIGKPEIDMCGEASLRAMQTLEQTIDSDSFLEMEELMAAGFEENARNGFDYGFRCAATLLTGGTL